LNGLTLDGDNVAYTTGIAFSSGGALHVQNCVIRNFGANGNGNGITFAPSASTSSQISVSNTVVADNAVYGIYINPTGSGSTLGVLDHVEMDNNAYDGLFVDADSSTTNVNVTDSVAANNNIGIYAYSLSQHTDNHHRAEFHDRPITPVMVCTRRIRGPSFAFRGQRLPETAPDGLLSAAGR
jgi:hypothetical protein